MYRLHGGKGKKKSTADSVTTQTSDLSSLTAKVGQLTSSVAKISQIVAKRQSREQDDDGYDSCEMIGFNHPTTSDEEDGNQSLKSASSSKSPRRGSL